MALRSGLASSLLSTFARNEKGITLAKIFEGPPQTFPVGQWTPARWSPDIFAGSNPPLTRHMDDVGEYFVISHASAHVTVYIGWLPAKRDSVVMISPAWDLPDTSHCYAVNSNSNTVGTGTHNQVSTILDLGDAFRIWVWQGSSVPGEPNTSTHGNSLLQVTGRYATPEE